MRKLPILIAVFLLSASNGISQEPEQIQAEKFTVSVDSSAMTASEVLSTYIQHKSISGNEKEAGAWLRQVCIDNGLHITQFGAKNGNYNFAASVKPLSDSLPNILFLNHIDVVPEGDTGLWIHPPYSGYISDTEIWGRGAFDNKGAAIMQLLSILKFKAEEGTENLTYNVTFLSVSCEETQCGGGASYVAENHIQQLNPVIVIGEGATELSALIDAEGGGKQFGISVTQKRPMWLKLKLSIPTSGHGSAPPNQYPNKELTIALSHLLQMRQDAIYTPINKGMLRNLGDNESGITRFILKHPVIFKPLIVYQLRATPELFALFSNTMTLTVFGDNNATINKIPGYAEVFLDCRLMPEYSKEEFIKSVRKALRNNNIEVSVILEMNETPPSDRNGDFYLHMKEAVENIYSDATVFPLMLPNFNDVAWFRSAGIQGLSIIPVEMGKEHLESVHKENERLPIHALYQGIDTYLEFIKISMSK